MTPAPNPFAAAAAAAGTAPKTSSKKADGEIFLVKNDEFPDVATAIDEFVEADGREKLAKAEKAMAKGIVVPHCLTAFLKTFAKAKRKPDKSLKFRTEETKDEEGKVTKTASQVTLVVQDRGELYVVSDEQMQTLIALVGKNQIDEIVVHDMTFSFNNEVLNEDGVMAALGAKIGELVDDPATKALKDLLAACTELAPAQKSAMSEALKQAHEAMAEVTDTSDLLTAEQAATLLVATPRTTVRKGVIDDLGRLCGNDPEKMLEVIEGLGSHTTQYIKA